MTSSCPYCGATKNLNYCVNCGRQSSASMNKMGSLKTVARNTDATQRLDGQFEKKIRAHRATVTRLKRIGTYFVKAIASGCLIAALFAIIANQASDLFQMQSMVAPWMKSHRIVFPGQMQISVDSLKNSINRTVQPINKTSKQNSDVHKHKIKHAPPKSST